ncbi:MAG: LamG domain-containing protein, partial [Rhodothermia bacterium]|nr:LamG domain-containing protein [Rhodothermia bacterium]
MSSRTLLLSAVTTCILILSGFALATDASTPELAVDARLSFAADDSVRATGPNAGTTLEDRVEVLWSTATSVDVTSTFHITRDDTLIAVAAPTETLYEDFLATPHRTYEYCVSVVLENSTETLVGCDDGSRVIAAPLSFEASDGLYEDLVLATWSDQSEIEGGFNIYRDAGNALRFDGSNDFVQTEGKVTLDESFSFEFWARRATSTTSDIVINVESNPNGDPVNVDLEVGFDDSGQFLFMFGTNALVATDPDPSDGLWHHWAIAYDSPNLRRFIYRDGVRIATDVLPSTFRPFGDLEFGRAEAQGPSRQRGHFGGDLDEVRYWDIALTEEEVNDRKLTLLTGDEPGLASYWPMDVQSGLLAPDAVGDHSVTLMEMNPATAWVPTGVAEFRGEVGANLTSYADRMAVIGFQTYDYRIAAFEDVDDDGSFTFGTDFESLVFANQMDDGWRGFLTPPGDVSATDGQYNDRVVITWNDLTDAEDSYRIYRDAVLVGTVDVDETSFAYLTAPTVANTYCVAAVGDGVESVQMCDDGMAGGLAPPADVAATDNTFDDRVSVSWSDTTDTEDGFQLFRDDLLLATLDADTEEYNDFSAAQGVQYNYCVGSFSKADPLDPA